MAGETPDFIPAEAPDFIPAQVAAPTKSVRPLSMAPKLTPENAEASATLPGNRFERYMQESENMTAQGAKEHPLQNALGRTVTRARDFGNIVATMGSLFAGPEGLTPAAGMHESPQPIISRPSSLTPRTTALARIEPTSPPQPLSMREQLGGTLPVESTPKVAPIPTKTMPSRTPALGNSNLNPTPASPPEPKPLSNAQLGRNIEAGVKEAAGTPTLRPGVSLRNQPTKTVGAKTVTAEPFTEAPGPRIDTASKNLTTGKVIGEQVETGTGGKPAPSVTRGFTEKGEPVQTTASERNKGTFYEKLPDKQRQDIHVNLEVDRVPVPNAEQHWQKLSEKPEVRDDLFAMQNDQVREALRKSGIEDLGNKTVKSSDMVSTKRGGPKFKDPDVIPRAVAIGKMLDAGIPPEDIIKWGGGAETRTKVAPERFKFGEPRLENPLKGKP